MKAKILVALIVLIILIGGGFFVWQNGFLSKIPFLNVSNNETADWQTCTNQKDGFLIKYPQDYPIDKTSCNYNPPYDALLINSTPTDALKKDYVVTISVFGSSLPLQDEVERQGGNLYSEPKPGPIVNSLQIESVGTHFASIDTFVKKDRIMFRVSLGARNASVPVSESVKQIYNKIASTFRLLEEKSEFEKNLESARERFHLVSPNGGEIWEIGKTYSIDWKQPYDVSIWLEDWSSFPTKTSVINDNVAAPPYLWTIPSSISPGVKYKIGMRAYPGVKGATIAASSDDFFSIIQK